MNLSTRSNPLKCQWDPFFYQKFSGFEVILPLLKACRMLDLTHWPTLDDFNKMAKNHFDSNLTLDESRIHFVHQDLNMDYESEIKQFRCVPTRLQSWHDYFNNLTWLIFSKSKWSIIKKVESYGFPKGKIRNPLQNCLAHFDECGMIICSDKPELFELICHFKWKDFFCNTPDLLKQCHPILFGHGLLEKALDPYIGMTGKAIFCQVPSGYFQWPMRQKLEAIDDALSQFILSKNFLPDPQALTPFPLLGWPGWCDLNNDVHFYDNPFYFRANPKKTKNLLFDMV